MTRFLVALLLASLSAEPQTLSLAEAVSAAMQNFPAVAASTEEARAARETVREMEAARLPSVNLNATATHYSDPALATPIHGFDFRNPPPFETTLVQSSLVANYALFDAGARAARIEESRHNAESVEAATDTARQNAAARAASAYAGVLGQAAILDAHRLRITALEAERERVRQFQAVGRAANVDALRVEAALAAAEAERTDAAALLDSSERSLSRITGLPLETTRAANLVPVKDAPAVPDRAVLEARVTDAPAVQQARGRELAQKATIEFAKSGRWPQVSAAAQELLFATHRALLATEWNVGLQLRFNVFDGGATAARIARATHAARAAGEQVRTAEVETGIALDRALASLEQSRATVESLSGAVAKFAEVARIEKLRLENGAGTQADYLRAEADLVAARASLAAARYRVVAARVELARVTGELQPEWVAATFGAQE